jgi:hypothetical protein
MVEKSAQEQEFLQFPLLIISPLPHTQSDQAAHYHIYSQFEDSSFHLALDWLQSNGF